MCGDNNNNNNIIYLQDLITCRPLSSRRVDTLPSEIRSQATTLTWLFKSLVIVSVIIFFFIIMFFTDRAKYILYRYIKIVHLNYRWRI